MTTTADERTARIEEVVARPYARVLERQPDGRFVARILEFPDVVTDDDNAEDAIAYLDRILRSYLDLMIEEGRAIPEPLAEGEYSGRLSLRIPPSLHAECARLAASLGVSMNRFLSDAVARHVGAMSAREQPAFPRRYRRRASPRAGSTRRGGRLLAWQPGREVFAASRRPGVSLPPSCPAARATMRRP